MGLKNLVNKYLGRYNDLMNREDPDFQARVRRGADFLEKISAASLVVTLFQGNWLGLLYCVLCLALSLLLTHAYRQAGDKNE